MNTVNIIEKTTGLKVISLWRCWEDIEAASTIGDDRTVIVATLLSTNSKKSEDKITMTFKEKSGKLVIDNREKTR